MQKQQTTKTNLEHEFLQKQHQKRQQDALYRNTEDWREMERQFNQLLEEENYLDTKLERLKEKVDNLKKSHEVLTKRTKDFQFGKGSLNTPHIETIQF